MPCHAIPLMARAAPRRLIARATIRCDAIQIRARRRSVRTATINVNVKVNANLGETKARQGGFQGRQLWVRCDDMVRPCSASMAPGQLQARLWHSGSHATNGCPAAGGPFACHGPILQRESLLESLPIDQCANRELNLQFRHIGALPQNTNSQVPPLLPTLQLGPRQFALTRSRICAGGPYILQPTTPIAAQPTCPSGSRSRSYEPSVTPFSGPPRPRSKDNISVNLRRTLHGQITESPVGEPGLGAEHLVRISIALLSQCIRWCKNKAARHTEVAGAIPMCKPHFRVSSCYLAPNPASRETSWQHKASQLPAAQSCTAVAIGSI